MVAKVIDGKEVAQRVLREVAGKVAKLARRPKLAVLVVGDNPASQVYVRNKVRACEETGLLSQRVDLPADSPQEAVLERVRAFNHDESVHGVLVQLPLPPQVDEKKVLETLSPEKDVDGFHAHHMGRLVAGAPSLYPCTPRGCMVLLEHSGTTIEGAQAVVVGRSHIVGKPMMLMLLNAGATVTVCHSKTGDLAAETRRADILVAAVGRPRMITGDMVKAGATVIDVGINRLPEGGIAGDVDFDSVREVAGAVTPVPGGVGPMTIAMLVTNTLQAAGLR